MGQAVTTQHIQARIGWIIMRYWAGKLTALRAIDQIARLRA